MAGLGASGVTKDTLKTGVLAAVICAFPGLAAFPDGELDASIAASEATVAAELGIRWGPTAVTAYIGAGASASPVPWDPGTPGTDGTEQEPSYDWPGWIPGDGFIRLKPRLRPIIEIQSVTLNIPGAIITNFPVPLDWLRVDRTAHEILVAPSGGSALFALSLGMGAMRYRLPGATLMNYRAGLRPGDLDPGGQWAMIRRLVQLQAALNIFPQLSLFANPGQFTSESADGLSQSRGSAYVFRDLEDRYAKEVEDLKTKILGFIEGPGLFFL